MNSVSVALTSCGRVDLLYKTLDSFFKYNTYKIDNFFITEDKNNNSDQVKNMIEKYFPQVTLIVTESRIGQLKAVDLLYSKINTDYIFHCEDDWLFKKEGFIEKSINILESDDKILQVHIRAPTDLNGQPTTEPYFINQNIAVRKLHYNFMDIWHGFSFNPGLRKKSVVSLIEKFSNFKYEYEFSIFYKNLGFYAVVIDQPSGFVEHIGWNRHIVDPYGV